MSLRAQEQRKHGDLGQSLSQLFHNIVVTILDYLQNFLHFLFGGVFSNFLWYFCLSRMSHWFFPRASGMGSMAGVRAGVTVSFGGEISGENTLPVLVTLLDSVMLSMSGMVASTVRSSMVKGSCLTPW